MAKVLGIGGIHFRAGDWLTLAEWYETNLGVTGALMQVEGPAVFIPVAPEVDHLPTDRPWMITFRVDDLDAIIQQLRSADITVETREEWDNPRIGRHARLADPEGNLIELWQLPADV